jgi:Na+-translocating ferredoxin:NAD+ oxidoreductase RNF subunit RnfB
MRKSECSTCGFIAYASAAAYMRAGMPVCGCGDRMVLANLRDIAELEPERLDGLSERAFNQAMRELGHTDMIHAKQPPRRTSQPQCAEPTCSRFRRRGARYCHEHEDLEQVPF